MQRKVNSKAIESRSISADHYNRGLVKANSRDFNGAITDYNKAIELNPNYAEAYKGRGWAHHGLKQYVAAIKDYSKAIELKPDFALAYNNRGLAKANSRDFNRAITDYNKAIELKPDYVSAYLIWDLRSLHYGALRKRSKTCKPR